MRILAASDTPLDSPRAHTINVLKTAGGFQRAGHEVLLCARLPEAGDPGAALADLGEPSLPCLLADGKIAHSARDGGVAFGHWIASIIRETAPDLVYARHFHAAIAAAEMGRPAVLETHAYVGDTNPALLAALRATRTCGLSIVTISPRLRAYYVSQGADPERIRIVPDGVDCSLFEPGEPCESLFEASGPHVLYAGHLYDHKGIPSILDAAALLPSIGFHLLGGLSEDIDRVHAAVCERGLGNVTVHGRMAHAAVPPYLWHADALLLPPSGLEASKDWTSPVKLGEYLASSTPLVCTDLPALRDWIPSDLVEWASPDNGASLASAIGRCLALSDKALADRACRALELARSLSYPNRARAIVRAASAASESGLRIAA